MAKTLIGNIKGKDGRGISKIERTATTGAVDTYTITYSDGTQSTYELRNSDDIAIQRQIVPSAAVESSTTASQAYSAGNYVVVNGVLRKVTASIAKGSAISDSNSTATTVTGEIATGTHYNPGDVISGTYACYGVLTGGGKTIELYVPLSKSCKGLEATLNSITLSVRQPKGGYLFDLDYGVNLNKTAEYHCGTDWNDGAILLISLTAKDVVNATNNMPVSGSVVINVTFS